MLHHLPCLSCTKKRLRTTSQVGLNVNSGTPSGRVWKTSQCARQCFTRRTDVRTASQCQDARRARVGGVLREEPGQFVCRHPQARSFDNCSAR